VVAANGTEHCLRCPAASEELVTTPGRGWGTCLKACAAGSVSSAGKCLSCPAGSTQQGQKCLVNCKAGETAQGTQCMASKGRSKSSYKRQEVQPLASSRQVVAAQAGAPASRKTVPCKRKP
jgi:hypothetical protein